MNNIFNLGIKAMKVSVKKLKCAVSYLMRYRDRETLVLYKKYYSSKMSNQILHFELEQPFETLPWAKVPSIVPFRCT